MCNEGKKITIMVSEYLQGQNSRSTSSGLARSLDSEDPFCIKKIVNITNNAICRNSLPNFKMLPEENVLM